jgi:hypothetical protein
MTSHATRKKNAFEAQKTIARLSSSRLKKNPKAPRFRRPSIVRRYPNEYRETAPASAASVTLKNADSGSMRMVQENTGLPNGRLISVELPLKIAAADPTRTRSEPANAVPHPTRRAAGGRRQRTRLAVAPASQTTIPLRNSSAITGQTPRFPPLQASESRQPGWSGSNGA